MSNLEITIINGPNLNLLDTLQSTTDNATSLHGIEQTYHTHAVARHARVHFFQDNSKGALIERVYQAHRQSETPAVALHPFNARKRKGFLHCSYLRSAVKNVICGFDARGYILAIDAALRLIKKSTS